MNTEYKLESGRFPSSAGNRENSGFQNKHLTFYNNNDFNTNFNAAYDNVKPSNNDDTTHINSPFTDQQLTSNQYDEINNNMDDANLYPQPPILETDWKNKFLTKSIKSSSREKKPTEQETELQLRKSNRQLLMSHYNPGICIYRPPSNENEQDGDAKSQDNCEETQKDNKHKTSSSGDIAVKKPVKNDKNNNNQKNGKVLKKTSNLSDVSYKMFYNKYNMKMKNSTGDIYDQKNADVSTQLNNNSIPPGGSILTMAKNMVKKYQPPVTPDKPISDFYSFFKNNGSNMFVSLSNQDLLDESYSGLNYDEMNFDDFSTAEYGDDFSSKMKLNDDLSMKKFNTHVEKVPMINESNKKSRIYVNTNLPIKRVYNAGSAANFLKERFQNRSLKVSESREGYDQTVHKVMKNLYDSWLEQSQCDVAIVTDDGEVMAHQALLSSFSSSLARQFKANKPYYDNDHNSDAPQQIAVIDMSKFSKETITDLLHFLYTTDIRLTDGNVTKFLLVAKKLELEVVLKKCEEYLLGEGQNDDLLLHYFIANNCDISRIKTELQSKIAKNFNKICVKNNITKLSRSLLIGILEHNDLISKEENKLLAVSKWIEHNKNERMKCVAQLMTYVSFEKIPIDMLTDLVENLEWMFTSSCMRNKLLEAYKYHTREGGEKTSMDMELSKENVPSEEICDDNNNAYKSFNKEPINNKVNLIQTTENNLEKKVSKVKEVEVNTMPPVETVEKASSIEYKCFPEKIVKQDSISQESKVKEVEKVSVKEPVRQPSFVETKAKITSDESVLTHNTLKQRLNKSISSHETLNKTSLKAAVNQEINGTNSRSTFVQETKSFSTTECKNQPSNKSLKVCVDKCSPKNKGQMSNPAEGYYKTDNNLSYEQTDYNYSNCQNLPRNRKLSQQRILNNDMYQNHVGTSMTPAPFQGGQRRDSSCHKAWKGASQGVISFFESKFQPPPVKQYQLQNNLAALKFIEMDPNL